MPRMGLDFALDSLGGALGGGGACDFSTYSTGLKLNFVDDGSGNMVPETGPTKFRNDYSAWDLAGTPVDLKTSGFSEELCFTMRETVKTSSRVLEMDFLGGSVQISYELINKRFVFRVATTAGSTQSTSNFGASDTNLEYRIKIWDDINDPDSARTNYWELYDENDTLVFSANFAIDWTSNANGIVTAFFMASRSPNVSETDLDLKWHDSSNFGLFSWTTRLKTATDPDRNKMVSSTGYKMNLFDDAEEGMLFPHIGLATVESLVSDTQCAGNDLQIIDGIAQSINGVFQHIP